mmetsp:Transcript_3207/g.9829  ORF Transcript_3207/g.9829 Transcript_3207/m.9829 type:complete len:462 (+) Transcript_3207:186-1571(+)
MPIGVSVAREKTATAKRGKNGRTPGKKVRRECQREERSRGERASGRPTGRRRIEARGSESTEAPPVGRGVLFGREESGGGSKKGGEPGDTTSSFVDKTKERRLARGAPRGGRSVGLSVWWRKMPAVWRTGEDRHSSRDRALREREEGQEEEERSVVQKRKQGSKHGGKGTKNVEMVEKEEEEASTTSPHESAARKAPTRKKEMSREKKESLDVDVVLGLGRLFDLGLGDDGGPAGVVFGALGFLLGGGLCSMAFVVREQDDGVDDELHGQGAQAEEEAEAPLLQRERLDLEEEAGELDQDVLQHEGRADDAHEERVALDAVEDVPLAQVVLEAVDGLEFARVEFVQDRHQHERVEDDREVVGAGLDEVVLLAVGVARQVEDDADEGRAGLVVRRVGAAAHAEVADHERPREEQEHHHDELVRRLPEHVVPHDRRDHRSFLAVGHALQQRLRRRLGRQSDGS